MTTVIRGSDNFDSLTSLIGTTATSITYVNDTTYQNTYGHPIVLYGSMIYNAGMTASISPDNSTFYTTYSNVGGSISRDVVMVVPTGWYWNMSSAGGSSVRILVT